VVSRKIDPGAWRVASYAKFDGTPDDCFGKTTMHISLLEWTYPLITTHSYGQRDVEVVIIEAVVSVRDGGAWVADVDVILAMQNITRILPRASGPGQTTAAGSTALSPSCKYHDRVATKKLGLTALDTWDEILDIPPNEYVVVRSYKNWLARLAITSVLGNKMQAGQIGVCPEDTCFQCLDVKKKGFKVIIS